MKHTVITGHYGSGKTNIAVNLALLAARNSQKKVFLIDADIVNPYFRSADNEEILKQAGVELIAPMSANTNLDIPAMPATISRVFNTDCEVIWDIGGDDAGAIVLGRYAEDIKKQGYEMIYVVNFYRPMTESEEDMTDLLCEIEKAAKLKATAIADNSNLGPDTEKETVTAVDEKLDSLAKKAGLPVKYRCVDEKFAEDFPSYLHLKMVTKKLW